MSNFKTYKKALAIRVDSAKTSSDGGLLLLKKVDEIEGLTRRMASRLSDGRRGRVVHTVRKMLSQRVFGISMGWEDCNDFSDLREDPLYPLALNASVATQPTLSRFENAVRIRDLYSISKELVEVFIDRFRSKPPRRIVLDIDGTVDPAHGQQQFEGFNGYYGCHCYSPLLLFASCDGSPMEILAAVLRPGDASAGRGAAIIIRHLGERLKAAFPRAQILVRADGGFAVPEFYLVCEELELDFLVAIASNFALNKKAEALMIQAREKRDESQASARCFGSFLYSAQSWKKKERRIIFKAEALQQRLPKDNLRYVVTNLEGTPEDLYAIYCLRGDSENRIKEMKLDLASGRTSCSRFTANFFRLLLHALAFALLSRLKEYLAGAPLARCTMGQIRLKLLKIAVIVEESTRRYLIRLPRGHPQAHLLGQLLAS